LSPQKGGRLGSPPPLGHSPPPQYGHLPPFTEAGRRSSLGGGKELFVLFYLTARSPWQCYFSGGSLIQMKIPEDVEKPPLNGGGLPLPTIRVLLFPPRVWGTIRKLGPLTPSILFPARRKKQPLRRTPPIVAPLGPLFEDVPIVRVRFR